MYTVDDLVSELFHLQDYGMGEKPIKVKVQDKAGKELFYLPLENIGFDNPDNIKDVVLTVKLGSEDIEELPN